MRWFRFYADALNDPKVQRLSPGLYRLWTQLLCLACEDENGALPSVKEIAFRVRLRSDRCQRYVSVLTEVGLLDASADGLIPHNWGKFQYKSDDVTARVKRFRNVSETPPDTETETEKKQSSDPSDRVPPAPEECRANFFRGRKPNEWVAPVIDLWQRPLSKEQRRHLGGLLRRYKHGQRVWDAVEASKDAEDPVQFMERLLNDGKRDAGRAEKEPRASPFEGFGRTSTSGGETT